MNVRLLEEFEKEKIMPLYREVFNDSDDYVNYFSKKVLPESSVFSCTADGIIVGMLCLIPKKIRVGRIDIPCRYIYGVATGSAWRRKGVMSRIMREAVNHLYRCGTSDYFTYLIPLPAENAAIYEKYDFGTVMDKLCGADKTDGVCSENQLFKRRAGRSDIGRLSAFAATQVSKSYGVYLTKDERYFENMFSLMEAEDGSIDIYYTTYDKPNSRQNGRTDRIMAGYRIGFDDETVEEIYDEAVIRALNRTSRMKIGNMPGCKTESAARQDSPYIMARILNIRKMIPLMRTVEEGEIILNVEDSVIDENNGTFLWRYGKETCSFEKICAGNKKIMAVGIGELASHIFGYARVAGLPEISVKKGVFINDYV